MEKLKEKINILKENNKFFSVILNVKNSAIIILSFLLFITIVTYPDSSNSSKISELNDKIQSLNAQLYEQNKKLENNPELQEAQKQIKNLQDANKSLTEKNKTLEDEKTTLENEKNSLNTKLEEAQKTSATNTSKSQTASISSSSSSKARSTSSNSSTSNSQMVWVGNTGTKYHVQSCRTLKGKGNQITMQQALAEGRQACKVCH
jgi:DNA repair exonuclease SbcCD ATPase subunit